MSNNGPRAWPGLLAVLFTTAAASACDSRHTTTVLPFAPTSSPPVTATPLPTPTPPRTGPEGGEFTFWHGPGPDLDEGQPIEPVQQISGRILSSDRACFVLWDQTGRCQQFAFRAQANGDLGLVLEHPRWTGPEMTLFIVFPDGTWMFGEGFPTQRTSIRVAAGMTYHLVVMSYAPAPSQDFVLAVDFRREAVQ